LSLKLLKITQRKEYRDFHRSRFLVGDFFVVYYLPSKEDFCYGITVTKKIGNAVVRNRCKRIAKSLIRNCHKNTYLKPLRVNIIAKTAMVGEKFSLISKDFSALIGKLLGRSAN
jgi:ribonuclease P protein component